VIAFFINCSAYFSFLIFTFALLTSKRPVSPDL